MRACVRDIMAGGGPILASIAHLLHGKVEEIDWDHPYNAGQRDAVSTQVREWLNAAVTAEQRLDRVSRLTRMPPEPSRFASSNFKWSQAQIAHLYAAYAMRAAPWIRGDDDFYMRLSIEINARFYEGEGVRSHSGIKARMRKLGVLYTDRHVRQSYAQLVVAKPNMAYTALNSACDDATMWLCLMQDVRVYIGVSSIKPATKLCKLCTTFNALVSVLATRAFPPAPPPCDTRGDTRARDALDAAVRRVRLVLRGPAPAGTPPATPPATPRPAPRPAPLVAPARAPARVSAPSCAPVEQARPVVHISMCVPKAGGAGFVQRKVVLYSNDTPQTAREKLQTPEQRLADSYAEAEKLLHNLQAPGTGTARKRPREDDESRDERCAKRLA